MASSALDTDPPPHAYLLWKIFTMPTDAGGRLAVTVPGSASSYFVSVYTIILGSIFAFGWQFVTYLIITFYPTENDIKLWPKKNRMNSPKDGKNLLSTEQESLKVRQDKANRYVALISVWNTTDPASAMLLLVEHAWLMCTKVDDQITCLLDVIVLLLTIGFIISAAAARVLISTSLFIGDESRLGNVAPVNSSSVFYWVGENGDPDRFRKVIRLFTYGGSSVMRAMGAAESITEETKKRVGVLKADDLSSISYGFNISGVEFGLQHASDVTYSVNGKCTLEYRWIESDIDNGTDLYYHPDLPQPALLNLRNLQTPAIATSYPTKNFDKEVSTGNYTNIIIFATAGRFSFYPGTDPMYKTIVLNSTLTNEALINNIVDRGRPALYCWEQTFWTYKDITVRDIYADFGKIPDKVIPFYIKDELIPYLFGSPRYPTLMKSLGGAVLASSSSSGGPDVDAGLAKWQTDMERLFTVHYISTRNAFRDSTLSTSLLNANNEILVNAARLPDGSPKPGLDDMVIGSSQITTMSLTVLIVIPVVWLLVWVIICVFRCNRWTNRNSGKASRFTLRAVGLQAVQMYRLLDEEVCGYRDDWKGRKTHMPYIKNAKGPSPTNPEIITNSQFPQQNPSTPLFAAPKVEIDRRDGRYHLKFLGPLDFDPKVTEGEPEWTWRDVAGGPRPEPSGFSIGGTSEYSNIQPTPYEANQPFNPKGTTR